MVVIPDIDDWSDLDDFNQEVRPMSKQVSGVVSKIMERSITTKRGPSTVYSVCIDDEWYGAGFDRPDFREGTNVSFQSSQNNRGYWQIDGRVSVNKDEPTQPSGSAAGAKAVGNRDKSITLQTAMKVAPGIVKDMFDLGILSFPKTKKDAQEAYFELIEQYAYQLQARFLDPDTYNPLADAEEESEDQANYGEFDD